MVDEPAGQRCDLGAIRIDRIVDLDRTPFSVFDIYPDAQPASFPALAARLPRDVVDVANAALLLSFHSLLIRVDGLNILVDTCCGDHKERPQRPAWHRRQGPYLANLAAAGVSVEDIDIVMCTHLHADHVGWNTRLENGRWVPTFPNARYLFSEIEYCHWEAQHTLADAASPILYGSFADSVLPVMKSGQAELVGDRHRAHPKVELLAAPGHTPGNLLIRLAGDDREAVLCGDVLHHPIQLLQPLWSTRFCADPQRSRQTRLALLDEVADRGDAVLPAHFRSPWVGRVVRDGSVYRFEAF